MLRPVRAAVGLAVLVLVLLVTGPAAAETELDVTTPADGRYQPGQPTPLLVTITADGAVSGTLTASFDGFIGGSERVEVPGGSAKKVVLIATAPPWGSGGTLTFDADDGADDASARLDLTANREDELVAVFPDLASGRLPATAELDAEVGLARLYGFDPELLRHGPEVLSPFSHVVVTADDLDRLSPEALTNLEGWVGGVGGRLVVDEPSSTPLPLSVAADGDDRIDVGTGEVRFTDGRLARTGYDGELAPTMSRNTDEFPWGGGFGGMPTTLSLAQDAGVSIPAIGSLVLVLIAYIVVAGPVLWLLLRRSRREPLLWLALPLGAIVTTLGVYAVGQSLRSEASASHATVVADLPNIRAVSTQVLVTSANGGRTGVELPDGWRPASVFSEEMWFEGPFGGAGRVASQPMVVGNTLVTDLPPGGVGVLSARSSTAGSDEPSWAIELVDVDGVLTGTVTNLTEHELSEAFISAGQGYRRLGDVAPGQSVAVELQNAHLPPTGNDRLMESLWRFDPWAPGSAQSAVNPGVLMEWLGRQPLVRTPGFVLVGGWTKEASGPLDTSTGGPVDSGRTAFLTASRVEGALGGEPYRLEILRGWNSTRVIDPFGRDECGELPLTLRMKISDPAVLGDEPVLDLSRRGVIAFDLWTGASWEPAGMADAVEDRVIVAVPPSALANDQLYLRVQLSCDSFGFANPFPDLRAAASDDEVLALGRLGGASQQAPEPAAPPASEESSDG